MHLVLLSYQFIFGLAQTGSSSTLNFITFECVQFDSFYYYWMTLQAGFPKSGLIQHQTCISHLVHASSQPSSAGHQDGQSRQHSFVPWPPMVHLLCWTLSSGSSRLMAGADGLGQEGTESTERGGSCCYVPSSALHPGSWLMPALPSTVLLCGCETSMLHLPTMEAANTALLLRK